MMGIHMTCSWRKADSLLMKDSGKATMGDDAFVIEKHLSAGVQLPECPSDFRSSFESFRSETLPSPLSEIPMATGHLLSLLSIFYNPLSSLCIFLSAFRKSPAKLSSFRQSGSLEMISV